MRRAVFLAGFVVLLVAGSVSAGSYTPPPGDCCPQWSPHGTQIVFETIRGPAAPAPTVGAVAPTSGTEHFFPGIPVGTRSPDWTHVAAVDTTGSAEALTVWKVDGTSERVLAPHAGDFAWSPDSKRIAFVDSAGALAVIDIDGSGLATIVPKPVSHLTWSPNGQWLAYDTGTSHSSVHVVKPDGSGKTNLTAGSPEGNLAPVWSPDSSLLAFWTSNGSAVTLTVKARVGTSRNYAIPGAVTNGEIVWAPSGKIVYGSGRAGLVGFAIANGKRTVLAGIDNAVFSPNGAQIAYVAGGECRDRDGLYVANADGTNRRRVTNSCRVVGTAGPDVLHGSFSQVVLGLGGNDTLYADDTYYFFDGDSLYGGPGNDRLIGGFGRDILNGGPGNDVISGGGSVDTITGGPGRDTINGGGGGDVIYARDGQRDVIDCGKNGYGKAGRDTVYADRIDVISNCEIVHRS
jgi:Tol biopolymer transport system component